MSSDSKLVSSIPEHCPGTQSEFAGKSNACSGCPNQQICSSKPKLPDPDLDAISERMSSVKHKLIVLSGKGGVGKSTFSSQLSFALSKLGAQVGLMDIDICGPSIPKLLGLEGEQIHQSNMGWSPVYIEENLGVMSVGFMLNDPNEAVIWRGPKKNSNSKKFLFLSGLLSFQKLIKYWIYCVFFLALIKQFLKDVYWGDLDYLVIDTPPGTSDEHLSINQYLKLSGSDGAIVITTPQEVSLLDVRKEINFCRKVGLPIIGIVENMSGFICPKCHTETKIFAPTTGGAEKMAKDMVIQFLGSIPLDPQIARACDEGRFYLSDFPDSLATHAFNSIFNLVMKAINSSLQEQ